MAVTRTLFFVNQDFIYLASASPRRRELLAQIGVPFEVRPADIEERREPGEAIEVFAQRMAVTKAGVIAAEFPDRVVLGADTVVVIDGEMLGKPADREAGLAMLERLSGRRHDVVSAVAVVRGAQHEVGLDRSAVWFREVSEAERRAYWETGEPADKAGAYAVQGIGAVFIERLEGSFSGVMGLPLFRTAALLEAFSVPVPGLAGGQAAHA